VGGGGERDKKGKGQAKKNALIQSLHSGKTANNLGKKKKSRRRGSG